MFTVSKLENGIRAKSMKHSCRQTDNIHVQVLDFSPVLFILFVFISRLAVRLSIYDFDHRSRWL